MKKQVVLSFVALFLLTFLVSINFVSAFWSELGRGDISGAFNSLSAVNSAIDSTWAAQVLFFFLVLVVVYGVSDYLPFFGDRNFLGFVFSLIVSILAVFFLNPEQIRTMLFSYKALGIVLTAIIPFFVIAAISKKSHDKGQLILSKSLWIAFIVFLLMMVWNMTAKFGGDSDVRVAKWTYLITIIASVLMLIFDHAIYFWTMKTQARADLSARDKMYYYRLIAQVETLREQLLNADGKTAEQLQKRIDELEERMKSFQ